MSRRFFLAALLLLLPIGVHAQTALQITPTLIDSSQQVTEVLEAKQGRAATRIEGAGRIFVLSYTTNEPITVFMVPMQGETFVPTDYIKFELPVSPLNPTTVHIDLSTSPGWSPALRQYSLQMLSNTDQANLAVYDIRIDPSSTLSTIGAAINHALVPEPYTPSTYHALRGYRMLSFQFVPVLAALMLMAVAFIWLKKKKAPLLPVLTVLVCGMLVYGLRVAGDLVWFSVEHMHGYYNEDQYDEAGSVYSVAAKIRELKDTTNSVYVCRSGTNFKEKLLRYFVYPVHVSAEKEMAQNATLALVMDDFRSKGDTVPEKDGQLKCNDLAANASLVQKFADGSRLFRISR